MKNKNIFTIIVVAVFFALQSCDKIEPPFTDGTTTPPPTSGNSTDVINPQNIKGTFTDFKVTDNWLSDSSALVATWTVTPTGSGADGSIIFTWHGISATLNVSSASGIITISGPVSITAGGFYGTLSFNYSGTFTSGGAGEGYVSAYVLNEQNILIEDYTGHLCGNCPEAAINLVGLHNIYNERLISMAVHAGFFAVTHPPQSTMYTYDFRNSVSNELNAFFGLESAGYPNGLVNRKSNNGSIIADFNDWGSFTQAIIDENKFPDAGIKIGNVYTASDSTLKINVKTCFLNNLTGTFKLCAYLVEDSVQKWQKKYPPLTPLDDEFYWHRDVLRGSANGTWGDILSPSSTGAINEKNYIMTVKNEFRAAYCKVVVFIYDDLTKQIVQVKEAPIIQ